VIASSLRVCAHVTVGRLLAFESPRPPFHSSRRLAPAPDPAPPPGHTTAWTLLHAATRPDVQERVAAELGAAGLLSAPGGPPPREMEYEDLRKLPYLTAVAKEAMRMLPVVSLMGRVTERPTRVGKYLVPPGVVVGTPLYAIQNTVHNWDAPSEFRPERWTDVPVETWVFNSQAGSAAAGGGGGGAATKAAAAVAATKEGITFMPFSDGPRSCVGQSLAKAEVITLLAKARRPGGGLGGAGGGARRAHSGPNGPALGWPIPDPTTPFRTHPHLGLTTPCPKTLPQNPAPQTPPPRSWAASRSSWRRRWAGSRACWRARART
jgi:hypothetical protein